QLDLRAAVRHRAQPRRAAVALHAADDRFSDAHAIGGYRVEVEARAAGPDGHEHRLPLDLGVDLHGTPLATVLGGVHHRLARGLHLPADPLVEGAVAHDDHFEGDAVLTLDLGGVALHGLGGGGGLLVLVLAVALRLVVPGGHVALLSPGAAAHHFGALGVGLDQRSRDHPQVVDVGGDFGAVMGPDPNQPFLGQVLCHALEVGAGQ